MRDDLAADEELAPPSRTTEVMEAAQNLDVVHHTVETLIAEVGQIVVERQRLSAGGGSPGELDQNKRRLAAAQSELSHLLVERHLPSARRA
jgi:hypothetical protein